MRVLSAVALLPVLLASTDLAAQAATQVKPDSFVADLIRAQRDQEWVKILQLAHPDAVVRFKRQIVSMMSIGMRALSPYASRAQRSILTNMFGVLSVDELKAAPADSLLLRFLRYVGVGNWPEPRVVGFVSDGDSVAYVVVRRPRPHFTHDEPMPDELADLAIDDETEDIEVMTLRRDTQRRWRSMLDGGLVFSMGGFALSLHPEDEPPQ